MKNHRRSSAAIIMTLIISFAVPFTGVSASSSSKGLTTRTITPPSSPGDLSAQVSAVSTSSGQDTITAKALRNLPAAISPSNGLFKGDRRYSDFYQVAHNGFGDTRNGYAWATAWFQGKLYVGTSRNNLCNANFIQQSPWGRKVTGCPSGTAGINLDSRAQVWAYTPQSNSWAMVFQSPMVTINYGGFEFRLPREVGYRSMAVYTDKNGVTALYLGTVSSIAEAHLIRTTDGIHFKTLDPAGFGINADSIRALTPFRGELFVAPIGSSTQYEANPGRDKVYMSNDPLSGKWTPVSYTGFGDPANGEIYSMAAFNNQLYAATSNTQGFELWRTPGTGKAPYQWTAVLINGGYRGGDSPTATAMTVFNNKLYIGSATETLGAGGVHGAASELIAVNPDDTWDLVMGEARDTPEGHKAPTSGYGPGFNSSYAVYLWSLASYDGWIYAGTYDYRTFELNYPPVNKRKAGFGLYRSHDGVHWEPVSTDGFSNPYNYGVRTMINTPMGFFVGTANPFAEAPNKQGGLEMWLLPNPGGLTRPHGFALANSACPMAHCDPNISNIQHISVPTNSLSTAWQASIPNFSFLLTLGCTVGTHLIACAGTSGSALSGSGIINPGYVRAYDFNGNLIWDSGNIMTQRVGGGVPLIDSNDNVYVSDEKNIVCFSPQGVVRWETPNPGKNTLTSLNVTASGFLVGQAGYTPDGTGLGTIVSLNPQTGAILGSLTLADSLAGLMGVWATPKTITVSDNRLYSAMQFEPANKNASDPTHQGRFYAIDVDNNGGLHVAWDWVYEGPTGSSPMIIPGTNPTIYFGGTGTQPGALQHTMMFAVRDMGSTYKLVWADDLTTMLNIPYPTTSTSPGIQTAAAHDPRGGLWIWSELDQRVIRLNQETGAPLEALSIPTLTGDKNASPEGTISIVDNAGSPLMIIGVLGSAGNSNRVIGIDLTTGPPALLFTASLGKGGLQAPYGQYPLVPNDDGSDLLVIPTYDGTLHAFTLS